MKREIAQFVAECDVCRRVKAEHQRPAGTLQPLSIPVWKWDEIGMDFITGLPKTQKGNDVVLSGSFWWKGVFSLVDAYRSITRCEVGSGHTILFWNDLWKSKLLSALFPRLYSFARDKMISVNEFMVASEWLQNFHLPLSIEAHDEFIQLQLDLHDTTLLSEGNDAWICTLGKGVYKPSLAYKENFKHLETHAPSCWLWKSRCQSKHKFFAWLLLHDRINTKDMLLRRHWNVTDNHNCELCSAQQVEFQYACLELPADPLDPRKHK